MQNNKILKKIFSDLKKIKKVIKKYIKTSNKGIVFLMPFDSFLIAYLYFIQLKLSINVDEFIHILSSTKLIDSISSFQTFFLSKCSELKEDDKLLFWKEQYDKLMNDDFQDIFVAFNNIEKSCNLSMNNSYELLFLLCKYFLINFSIGEFSNNLQKNLENYSKFTSQVDLMGYSLKIFSTIQKIATKLDNRNFSKFIIAINHLAKKI